MIFVFSRCEASQSWSNCWGTLWTSPPLTTAQARWTRHWSSQGEGCRKQPRTRLSRKGDHPYWLLVYQGDREDVLRANRTQTANLVPPIRQTASIFKQPVTVVKVGVSFFKNRPNWQFDHLQVHESKVKNDFKAAAGAEKPRQLFWEKRLNGEKFWFRSSLIAIFPGMGAKSVAADQFAMELPGSIKRLQAVIGEEVVTYRMLFKQLKKHPVKLELIREYFWISDNFREKLQPTFFWLPFPLLSTLAMARWQARYVPRTWAFDHSDLAGRPHGKYWQEPYSVCQPLPTPDGLCWGEISVNGMKRSPFQCGWSCGAGTLP